MEISPLIFKVLLLSLIFLNLSASLALSQNNAISNLLTDLNNETDPYKKSKLCYSIGDAYKYTDADSSIQFYKTGLKYAIASKTDSSIANGYYLIAAMEATRNSYEEALVNCDSAFKYFELTGTYRALAMVRNVQGGVYMTWGKNQLASQMYFDAITYTQDDTGSARILYTFHNLVILLNVMKQHTLALEYARKQYEWAKRIKIDDEIAYACSNIADTYGEMDSVLLAKPFILELDKLSIQSKDPYIKVIARNEMGVLYYNEKKYTQAIKYYLESLKLNDNLVDQQLGCNTLNNLGKAYQDIGLLSKADSCFAKTIEISTSIDVKQQQKDAYEGLMDNAVLQGDYKKAYHFMQLFHQVSDSLVNDQSHQALIDAETKYKSEEKNKEIELLNAKSKIQESAVEKQRLIKNIIIASLLLLIIIAALFFNRYKLKKKIERQQSLLKERRRISRDLHDDVGATLSSVKAYSEILKSSPDNVLIAELIRENATDMIEKLELIAWTANPAKDSFESLRNMINRYAVPLCQAKNIEYKFSTDGIKDDMPVPGEVRQTLYLIAKEAVNNSAKYSLAANCLIDAAIEQGKFIVTITDDGEGFDENTHRAGNGLSNMQTRLEEIGGEIMISSSPGKGTLIKAQMSYPFKTPDVSDQQTA